MKKFFPLILSTLLIASFFRTYSQQGREITDMILYRSLGPYRCGSWISAIAGPLTKNPEYKYTWYVAGRNGGVWKTVNNGTTFFPVFDSTGVSSIGAIAVSPSNPEIVWVGTGEAFNARSSHAGKGIFKSEDGGKTWRNMGLEDSQHISQVIVHPGNPDVIWVAVMGHLFTPNKMRGVYKTNNGGENWEKVLFIDENTGIIDLIINPQNPDVLFAAAYEKYRYPWHYEAGGRNSAIYHSDDGGNQWEKLHHGLPEGKLGRIGLALCYSQPETVYAVIENLNPKPGIQVDESIQMNYMRDPYFDQMIGGEVYRSVDGGINWEKRNDSTCNVSAKAAYSFNKIMVASDNPDIIYITSDLMEYSEDGGKTWPDCSWPPQVLSQTIFGDHRAFWMDPNDGRHLLVGSDGGLYESFDRGKTFTYHDQIPLGEIYIVETDNAYPYNIYLGLQDHDGWKGPSNSWFGQIGPEEWDITGMWDGMYTRVDPQDSRWAYITTQFGAHHRVDQLLGERVKIEPRAPKGNPPYRYCWTTPIELSPHNPKIIYTGAQMVLRSLDQGNHWEEISPDLTTNNPEKIAGKGHMKYCTITTLSESPVKAGIIWAGTDDGRIWMTSDHGKNWNEFTQPITRLGGKENYWVNRVVTSPHVAGKAFVCKSGYHFDDLRAMVYKTIDFGKTWSSIIKGLPESPVNVIAEDPKVAGLLYLGNDQGVYISFDDGENWLPFKMNMPPALVKDLKVHPTENDLIVGTYGRGAFIADIWPLQHFDDSIFQEKAFLFPIEPKPQRNFSERAWWGNNRMAGDNHLFTPNEPNGLALYCYLNNSLTDSAWIQVCDIENQPVDTLFMKQESGFSLNFWDCQDATPGLYRVKLHCGEMVTERRAEVKPSPIWPVGHGVKEY
jgi:photosystem II stability/assembly factor-like uncharacterized protein